MTKEKDNDPEYLEFLYQKYFAGKKSRRTTTNTQRDAITETEKNLYSQAVKKVGNDWKKILTFFVKHKDILSEHLAERYSSALANVDSKEKTKSIRSRLGNIGRKAKGSAEVCEREERHVLDESTSTAEELMLKIRKTKKTENADPLKNEVLEQLSDIEQPGPSAPPEIPSELTALEQDEVESDNDDAALPPPPPRKKSKKGKGKAPSTDELHAKADSLMNIGLQTAQLHMAFLRKSAKQQGISLSSGSESD